MRTNETGGTMKSVAQGLVVVALGLFLASSAAAGPGDGINGTVHDLSTGTYAVGSPDSLQRICIFCHAPHNTYKLSETNGGPGAGVGGGDTAGDAFDYLPLWNHELTANAESFQMYWNGPGAPESGAKASQAIQNGMVPGGTSLLCLSCHDGSVAVNSYGNASWQLPQSVGAGGIAITQQMFLIGKDAYLGNHHPIGFNYDAVAAVDTEIREADAASMGEAGTVRDHLYGDGNAMMECGTCHSVHNKGNTGETLLWRSDVNSQLCLTCHDKGDDPGVAP